MPFPRQRDWVRVLKNWKKRVEEEKCKTSGSGRKTLEEEKLQRDVLGIKRRDL